MLQYVYTEQSQQKSQEISDSFAAHEVNPALSPTAFAGRHELVLLRAQAETTRDHVVRVVRIRRVRRVRHGDGGRRESKMMACRGPIYAW